MDRCERCGHPLSKWAASCFECEDRKRAALLRSKSEADGIRFGIVKFGEKRLPFVEESLQQRIDALVETTAALQDPAAKSAMIEALALLLKYASDHLDRPVCGVHEESFYVCGTAPQHPGDWH